MDIVGLVMAGGEGKRLEKNIEKPLVPLLGKPMVKHVIDSLEGLEEVKETVVATSPHTTETAKFAGSLHVEVIETSGEGFHPDLKQAIRLIGRRTVLVISADLPLVRTGTLLKIINRFARSDKPSLSVFLDYENTDLDLSTEGGLTLDGKSVTPAGVNVIEGGKIEEPEIEQENLILSKPELGLNVNNEKRLSLARKLLSSRGGTP